MFSRVYLGRLVLNGHDALAACRVPSDILSDPLLLCPYDVCGMKLASNSHALESVNRQRHPLHFTLTHSTTSSSVRFADEYWLEVGSAGSKTVAFSITGGSGGPYWTMAAV
jgi:hypothetical protein